MAPIRVHLVCGAPTHDTNYARLELLKLLQEQDRAWVTVGDDFSDIDKIEAAEAIVVYSCNISPEPAEMDALEAFVERGGRMFALHATNALIGFTDGPPIIAQGIEIPGQVISVDSNPRFVNLLGSRFVAHLLLGPLHVDRVLPDHPLLAGIPDFDVVDEPYIIELTGECEVLLSARFSGSNPGYFLSDWPDAIERPQMYLRRQGDGEVLYLNLGHSSGKYDFLPLMEEGPVTRGPWESPQFRDLLRNALHWAVTR